MDKYYVYILKRMNGVPFYVGKGTRGRDKFHEWNARRGAIGHLYNVIRKILANGGRVIIERVVDGITNEQACALEKEWIAKLGKKMCGGKLVNITDGGEGAPGFKHDLISLARMREAWSKRDPMSDETKEKIRIAHLGKKHSQESRDKLSKSISGAGHWNHGKKITKEHAEKLHSSKRRCVLVDGQRFNSVGEAAIARGVSAPTAVYHLTNGKNRGGRHGVWCYAT